MKHDANNPRKVILECEHDLWLRFPPDVHERLWCPRCRRYKYQAHASAAATGRVYHVDLDIWSERQGKSYVGGCTYDGCNETITAWNFYVLRDKLAVHYSQTHTRFGSLQVTPTERPKRNALPPF